LKIGQYLAKILTKVSWHVVLWPMVYMSASKRREDGTDNIL